MIKVWRRLVATVASVGALVLLAACTIGPPSGVPETTSESENPETTVPEAVEGDLKAGIAAREIFNDYSRDIVEGAQALFEDAGVGVTVTNAQGDSTKLIDDIDSLINSGVNVLIIHMGDPTQLAPVVKSAAEQGVVVVTAGVGSEVPGSVADIGGDEFLMAEMSGRALLESIGYSGDVYAFWVPGAPLLETRLRVLEAMVADYPNVTLHKEPTKHSPAEVQSQMQTILTANAEDNSIAGIWGAYDMLASGAVAAIEQADRNEIDVVSIDGDRATFQMLFTEGGSFQATVVQDAGLIGQLAGEAALDASAGEPVGQTLTSSWVATRNNGIAAGEERYGAGLWAEIDLDPDKLANAFEQDQDINVVTPVFPRT